MNLGRMIRSGYATDDFTTNTEAAMNSVPTVKAEVPVEPIIVEKVVYVDKVIEKPVYIDRIVEVEKVVEVEVPVTSEESSAFFEDYVPNEWAKESVKAESKN